MIAMKVGRMMLLFFVISWMIIHFGINPDRGGQSLEEAGVSKVGGAGGTTWGTQQPTCSILGLKELQNLGRDLYHIYSDAATSPRI